MRNFLSLFIISLALIVTGCGGTSPVQESGVSTPQKVSDIKVRNAIIKAGNQYGWRMKIIDRGQILATRYKRGYMVSTEIKYSHKSYSLNYKAATKKSYYDEWIGQLDNAIRAQLHNS